jgi:hypothetical protein
MRLFPHICCVAIVSGFAPAFAQYATPTPTEASPPASEAALGAPSIQPPPTRVGRVSLVSGNVDLRNSAAAEWSDAAPNHPVFTGEAIRTEGKARAEIEIGANTIDVSDNSQIEFASLRDGTIQIAVAHGRIGVHLRQDDAAEAVEIDIPQGGIWLLAAGRYDIEAGDDQPPRIAVFDGAARFVGNATDVRIEAGQMTATAASDSSAVAIKPAEADAFVNWCREQEYDQASLAAPYYLSPEMTGFADLDSAGVWKIDEQYGPIWFPTASEEWAPYRFGHWSWVAPWGWTWIDDQPWGFAPSHYGRWVLIHEHWAWVPGRYIAHPVYAPAVVAFLGTPGVGLSSEEGAAAAWFPLAPGEVYWPSYARDVDYVRDLNRGSVEDLAAIRMPADGQPPLEIFNREFANQQYATVVPRAVFISGRPVAAARIFLPEQRLHNAPVLMASPQLAPAAPAPRVARIAAPAPASRLALRTARPGAAPLHAAAAQPRGRSQPVVIRAAHLRAPSYAGPARARQVIVLRVSHPRESAGKRVRG